MGKIKNSKNPLKDLKIKFKLLIPTATLLIIGILGVATLGYFTQRSSTYELLEDMLFVQVDTFREGLEQSERTAKETENTVERFFGVSGGQLRGLRTEVDLFTESMHHNFGEGSILTAELDGRIIYHKSKEYIGENLSDFTWGRDILKSDRGTFSYIDKGIPHHISYDVNDDIIVAAIIPSSTYTNDIRNFAFISTFGSLTILIISIVLLNIFYQKIIVDRLKYGLDRINQIESGNLNVDFNIESSDEIGSLIMGLETMSSSLRTVVGNISKYINDLNKMSGFLSETSENTSVSGEYIGEAVSRIADDTTEQVVQMQENLNMLDDLSGNLNNIYEDTVIIESKSEDIKNQSGNSIKAINRLQNRFLENEQSTEIVREKANNLQDKSKKIVNIIEIINSIAEETSLLSLNASIEAARAGEHGLGFAVVAQEIRSLSEQSIDASDKIEDIIRSIELDISETRSSVDDVAETVVLSNKELEITLDAFNTLAESTTVITDLIDNLHVLVSRSSESEKLLSQSINKIADVSEDTAQATEEISSYTNNQIDEFERVNNTSIELNKLADILRNLISEFKL